MSRGLLFLLLLLVFPFQQADGAAALQSSAPTAPAREGSDVGRRANAPAPKSGSKRTLTRGSRRRSHASRRVVSTRPQVTRFVKAEFPRELDKVEVSASVTVGMVVDTAGHPTALHIVRAAEDQEFNAEALRAVGQYRFRPAQRNHHAIAAPFRVTIEFSNQDVDDKQQ